MNDEPPFPIPVTFEEMQEMSITTPDGAWSRIDWPRFKALLIARDFPAQQIARMERDMAESLAPDCGPTIH